MSLKLPAKNAKPTPENIRALEAGLTSAIAGHPQSIDPWTFYEELDAYLGPWGQNGYPINYGKFYCVAFTSNEKLQANAETADWVRRTTVALQEALRNFVVNRFKAGTLSTLTEGELRQYAFDSHPQAYTSGGLPMVALVAPELLPVIVSIPRAEFDPRGVNFGPTVRQVLATIGLVAPQMVGNSLGALALPAHTGIFRRAVQMDQNRILQEQAWGRNLTLLQQSIERGELDSIVMLEQLTNRLNATEFPDQGFAYLARQVVNAANQRKRYVAALYRKLLQLRPDFKTNIDESQPGWSNW